MRLSGGNLSVNRREMLRWGSIGAAGAMLSSAASPMALPRIVYAPESAQSPRVSPYPVAPSAPGGIDPRLFEQAKAALHRHGRNIAYRDAIGIVDFSARSDSPRFHVVDLLSGHVESHLVSHGRGSDPGHSGWLERFSNRPGSLATSNGTYVTSDHYHGKYGLSMRLRGLDWTNNNAESRAIVIHNAWYAEPEVVDQHGKLGRSEGCFAFSRDSQHQVMRRLTPGHMIFADKIA